MTRTRRAAIAGAAVAAALAAMTACGRGPATHYYLLDTREAPAVASAEAGRVAIGVRAFHVDPPYDQDRIVYRVGVESPEIGFYAYHRWAAPLSRMMPRVVAAGLAGTVGGVSLEPVTPGRDYAGYLEGHVATFEEVDLAGGASVRVRMTLRLRDGDGVELWVGEVAGDRRVDSDRVADVVDALRSLLQDLAHEAADASWNEAAGRL